MTEACEAEIYRCSAITVTVGSESTPTVIGTCGQMWDNAMELAEHQHEVHTQRLDGWECGNCGDLYDDQDDAEECCSEDDE